MKYKLKNLINVDAVPLTVGVVSITADNKEAWYLTKSFLDTFFEPVDTSNTIDLSDIKMSVINALNPHLGKKIVIEPEIKFRTFHVIEEGVDKISQWERELGRITVAFQKKENSAYVIAQFAYCSFKDKYEKKYEKKYGQLIAKERLRVDPIKVCFDEHDLPFRLAQHAILEAINRNIFWMKNITADNLK